MLRLFIKDNFTGTIHEYGTSPHDSLYLRNGAIHYENLQCCASTEFPEEGYSFCEEDGTIPEFAGFDGYLDVGGEYYHDLEVSDAKKHFIEKLAESDLF